MPFTPLRALNGTQSMTDMSSPGDLPILCFLAYFGFVAVCHFFNSKPSKPYYTGAELSARWRAADKDTDTNGDIPWRDT